MWYRFSKLKWDFDRSIGIDYSYAYTKAETMKKKQLLKLKNLILKENMMIGD